jgi:HD-GYP domain-containing protein (c-di-GMP phosphodiesterase class II)
MLGGLAEAPRATGAEADLTEETGDVLARQLRGRESEIKQLAAQVARNYEEITLLHQLTHEAQVSQGVAAVRELALSLLADVLPVCQIAYVHAGDDTVRSVGGPVLEPRQCRELVECLAARATRRPLVENHPSTQAWAATYPSVDRLILVPVTGRHEQYGWLLALNTADGSELGSVEASLVTAVAAILATHQTNVKLFEQLQELFLGVVRALSSAIDAKDPYTCGHSERVAQVARRLGQELGLPPEELHRLYLSGLLHDVGKIGIRDSVLLKPGRLSDEELEHIKRHPTIGFEILSGVKQLESVLPGVRHHHERIDGTGYPDALKGEEIPLMARIMAVADSFDAITSTRPYRMGLSKEQTEQIFRDGIFKQWDSRVVQAFLSIHDEIRWRLASPSEHAAGGPGDKAPAPSGHADHDKTDLRRISNLFTEAFS